MIDFQNKNHWIDRDTKVVIGYRTKMENLYTSMCPKIFYVTHAMQINKTFNESNNNESKLLRILLFGLKKYIWVTHVGEFLNKYKDITLISVVHLRCKIIGLLGS